MHAVSVHKSNNIAKNLVRGSAVHTKAMQRTKKAFQRFCENLAARRQIPFCLKVAQTVSVHDVAYPGPTAILPAVQSHSPS